MAWALWAEGPLDLGFRVLLLVDVFRDQYIPVPSIWMAQPRRGFVH